MKSPLDILDWSTLDEARRDAVLRRPAQRDAAGLLDQARRIVDDVRSRGDAALREYTARLDGVQLESFGVSEAEFAAAEAALTPEQRAALERAIETVTRFHELQTLPPLRLETAPGVVCERMTVALEAVGLYVPAGTAPLPSTALMLAVPARIAGCPVRVMCTPPRPDGTADPAVLVAARLCGVRKVFKLGGAQAVAAMAYGTAVGAQGRQDLRPRKFLGHGGQADRGAGRRWRSAGHARRTVGSAGDRRRVGPARVRRCRPARAGGTQRGRAGHAGHDLAQGGRSLRRRSGTATGRTAAARDREPGDRREPRASSCRPSRPRWRFRTDTRRNT